jgi:hypothetical protein
MRRLALLRSLFGASLTPLVKTIGVSEAVTWRFIDEQPVREGFVSLSPGWWRFYPSGAGELVMSK